MTGIEPRAAAREGSLQWPCPARGADGDARGTERLYRTCRFPTPNGRARLAPTPHAEPGRAPDDDVPAHADDRAASRASGTR